MSLQNKHIKYAKIYRNILQNIKDSLSAAWESKQETTEIFLIAVSSTWLHTMTIENQFFNHDALYKPMSTIANSGTWALIFLVAIILQTTGLITKMLPIRMLALLFHGLVWTMIATMLLVGTPESTGWGVYYCIAILAYRSWLRLLVDNTNKIYSWRKK